MKKLAAVMVASLALASCSSQSKSTYDDYNASKWQRQEYVCENGSLSGRAGCPLRPLTGLIR